jgi:hypothetical protein
MARPKKQGIDYFPLDVSFFSDIKVRKILRACGSQSASILICLLCNIYSDKGYYILWDEDLPFVIADSVGVSEGAVKEVILKALQVEFFNQELYNRYKILTSSGIQSRFIAAVYKRKEIEYKSEYLVSDIHNLVSDVRNEVSDIQNTQSKVKEKNKDNNISPCTTYTPPKKGASINSKAREIFENYFKKVYSNDYYWTSKDAGSMTQLLKKLQYQRKQKDLPNDDDSVLNALQIFLQSIDNGWILDNFSVTKINSQFNEILTQIYNCKNGKSKQKPSTKVAANNHALDIYRKACEERGLSNEIPKPF